MNFQLKEARSGSSIQLRTGWFFDVNTGDQGTCGIPGTSCNDIVGQGGANTVLGNIGLPLGATSGTTGCTWSGVSFAEPGANTMSDGGHRPRK